MNCKAACTWGKAVMITQGLVPLLHRQTACIPDLADSRLVYMLSGHATAGQGDLTPASQHLKIMPAVSDAQQGRQHHVDNNDNIDKVHSNNVSHHNDLNSTEENNHKSMVTNTVVSCLETIPACQMLGPSERTG